MTISELIFHLSNFQELYGDIKVKIVQTNGLYFTSDCTFDCLRTRKTIPDDEVYLEIID